ncbi:hypothetical protein [Sphingobium tyrosinilyticum]
MFQDVSGKDGPHIMRPMRKKTVDRAPPSKGVQDAVALDHKNMQPYRFPPPVSGKKKAGWRPAFQGE